METKYKIGERFIEINYEALVEIVGISRIESEGHTRDVRGTTYWCKAVGWELPSWDNPTPCIEADLIPEEKKDASENNEIPHA